MITIPGQLAIKTIHGRNGEFNVGRLATSIGEFTVKNPELDQYKEGKYDGDFIIAEIRPSMYNTSGRMVIELRAHLGGMTLSIPRMVFALAKDGFLPRGLAAVHATHHTPHTAIIFQSLLGLGLAISGSFEKLAILANVSALALYFGCALASWRLRQMGVQDVSAPFRVPLAGIVPWLACGVIVWLLTGLTADEWLGFGVCIALASIVYFARRRGV